MGYAIMRFKKIKSPVTLNGVQRHNERKVPIKTLTHPENKNINILTKEIAENCQDKTFYQILKEKTNGAKPRKNAVLGLEFIFAFTPGCISGENIKEWSLASTKFLTDWFGINNVISVILHTDEASPHIHAVVIPTADGKLNCKHYINGPASCRAMQDAYYEAVKDFGDLQRGVNSKITKRIHESNKRWIASNAVKSEELEAYRTAFGTPDTWDEITQLKFDNANLQLSDIAI